MARSVHSRQLLGPGAFILCVSICTLACTHSCGDEHAEARALLDAAGIGGGLIVHLDCGDGKLTAALRRSDSILVHGLARSEADLMRAREHIRSRGLYGSVSVSRLEGTRLPYTDNLVNLLLTRDRGAVPMAEIVRVLRPGGVASIHRDGTWVKTVKPWPENIDEWTHYLHGPDGNPVAQDTVVGPPRHYQWISGPTWQRSHESDSSLRTLVTARGRLFYIADEAPTSLLGDHALPDKWFLTARDAFNGILLWKVPIKDWGWRAWKPSWFTPRPGDIPLNIEKRLVAVGDRVYVTLGYRAPVSELDARTGKILRTYDGTARTTEILYHDGRLVLTVLGEERNRVEVIEATTGKQLWQSEKDYGGTTTDYYRFKAMHGSVTPAKVDPTLNTALGDSVIALLDGGDVVCLDSQTGVERWRTPFPLVKADYKAGNINAGQTVWTGTLIVMDGVVVHASPNQLAGFSAATGKILWTRPKKYLGHLWYEWKDVFVIDGLVWTWSAELDRGPLEGTTQKSSWPVSVNGYDLHTGKLEKEVPLGAIFKTHHHHRCYRNKATPRYILASRRGTEYVDLEGGQHSVHNWVRGTCHVGMMPANGLQYAPPHPCVCYLDEKINGFHALAHEVTMPRHRAGKAPALLDRGPAFGQPSSPAATAEDWPAFRGDSIRSGSTKTELPATPKLIWQRQVGKRVTPPTVVGELLFVALTDEHHILALNTATGVERWRFAAGGRIDSPPTFHRGTVLFGSADGRVYCIDTATGRLVWRCRAMPGDRLIGAFGQLESAWPVSGSVLISDGTAYFVAGRSSHLDGGLALIGVDAVSGAEQYRTRLQGPSYEVDTIKHNYRLPMGTLPDILQGDGEFIYMRGQGYNRRLEEQRVPPRKSKARVQTGGGLLDDSFFKRIPWSLGARSSYARIIVHNDQAAFFLRMFDSLRGLDPKVYFTPGKEGYLLFAIDRQTGKKTWQKRLASRVNSMVATEKLLVVAGAPDTVDPKDPLGAFEGRKGGVLSIHDTADGATRWETRLSSPPVFNGLAAARQRFYLVMQDGSVACFGR